MSGVFVAGTGSYLPSKVITNEDLTKIVDTSDAWITDRTGIKERRFSEGEPTWYMASMAAKDALSNAGIDPSDIDMIIGCSITADFLTPSMACIIQSEIGAENAFCWDLNAACSGFIYAMDIAHKYLTTDSAKNVLIVCSEVLSKITDFTDRSTCVLFGDGAAAVLLQKDEKRLFNSFIRSEGKNGKALVSRSLENSSPFYKAENYECYDKFKLPKSDFIVMDGKEVYRFATKVLPDSIEAVCGAANLAIDEVDLFIPHQANIRIVKTAAEKLKISFDKIFMNIAKYGNTSCASIPICIDELNKSGRLKRGQKIVLSGFGGGLTYGSIAMEW